MKVTKKGRRKIRCFGEGSFSKDSRKKPKKNFTFRGRERESKGKRRGKG